MKIMQIIDFDTFKEEYINVAKECAPYADIIWFRIKHRTDIYERAKRLREALPEAFLSLSLDPDIAYSAGYDAVQLGGISDIADARRKYPSLKIGYSAHTKDEIISKDADYFSLSPVFYTKKDYHVEPIGVFDVSELSKKIYALGGINPENVSQLKGLGFTGVAGISFYKDLAEIRKAVQE